MDEISPRLKKVLMKLLQENAEQKHEIASLRLLRAVDARAIDGLRTFVIEILATLEDIQKIDAP